MNIPNKQESQQIVTNLSSYIDFDEFIRPYTNFSAEPYSFFVIDTTLPSDKPYVFGTIYWKEYRE